MHSRPTFAEVDLGVLKKNLVILKQQAGSNWFCPMIKANAYGHGATAVARIAQSVPVDAIGVATPEEGQKLREDGIANIEILVFGFLLPGSLELYERFNLTAVISCHTDLNYVTTHLRAPLKVHLKFNTGMNRLGFPVEDALSLARTVGKNPHLQLQGICSHLLNSEDCGDPSGYSAKQIEKFKFVSAQFANTLTRHIFNSTAILNGAARRWPYGVRPGIAMYGAGATPELRSKAGIYPVMSLHSEIRLLQKVAAGECVSYGCIWQAPRTSVIGVVPVGYADGVMRRLTNCGFALVRGQRVPLVGTVCMDYTMLNLSDLALATGSVDVGARVTFFGVQDSVVLSADEQAQKAQTIAYELFTGIGNRVPRKYIGDQ